MAAKNQTKKRKATLDSVLSTVERGFAAVADDITDIKSKMATKDEIADLRREIATKDDTGGNQVSPMTPGPSRIPIPPSWPGL
jgi:hypothetical protein